MELAQLHQLFAKARHGARQIVFVTGEAGIGKTALVDTFLASIRQQATGDRQQRSADLPLRLPDARSLMPEVWVGWGQCIEHYGAGEAYLPVLAAVSGLCQQAAGEQVLSVLRRVAPTWLVQLPALVEETDYAALQPKVAGATRERMLREMAEALEALSTERPLLLVLEDMHWSDVSTIDLLNLLARRRETARLLVLVTYRPAEVIISEHPLKQVKQELVTRGYGAEVVMGRLDVESVQQYVHQRAPDPAREADLATLVYQRTEGHPLFMVQMTEYLTQQEADGALPATRLEEVERLLPQQLRDLLAAQLGRLTAEEQAILETASVAGVEFTVASVAVGGAFTEEAVEATCEQLAQRGQFLSEREVAPWPDGTVSGRHGFRHALYQEVLYQRLSASRRARLHRQIGEREEAGYGERAHEIAAELAQHFEQGHEFHRAVAYLQKAADTALQRNAYAEAIGLLTQALALLQTWPDTAARNHQELTLQLALGESLMMHKGYSAPEAERAYTRALALCQVNTPSQLRFNVLTGLASLWIARGNFRRARELAEEGLTLAQQVESLPQQLQAQLFLGVACCYLGEPVLVHEYLAPGVMLYETQAQDATLEADETELVVRCLSFTAAALWMLGYPEQARQRSAQACAFARQDGRTSVLALALYLGCWVHQDRRDILATKAHVETLLALAREYELPFWLTWGQTYQGWTLMEQGEVTEGIRYIQDSLSILQAAGAEGGFSDTLTFLAEACAKNGQLQKSSELLEQALTVIAENGEHYYEAEVYRPKGELLLQQGQVTKEKKKGNRRKAKSPAQQ